MKQNCRRIRVEVVDGNGPRTVLMSPEEVLSNPVMLAQVVCRIDREIRQCSSELTGLSAIDADRFWRELPLALLATWRVDANVHHATYR